MLQDWVLRQATVDFIFISSLHFWAKANNLYINKTMVVNVIDLPQSVYI